MTAPSNTQTSAITSKLEDVVAELSVIKRLLAVALVKNGISQRALAEAFGVNQSTVSRMIAGREVRKRARK